MGFELRNSVVRNDRSTTYLSTQFNAYQNLALNARYFLLWITYLPVQYQNVNRKFCKSSSHLIDNHSAHFLLTLVFHFLFTKMVWDRKRLPWPSNDLTFCIDLAKWPSLLHWLSLIAQLIILACSNGLFY